MILIVAGVAGCGKSTVGAMLAGRLRWRFADAEVGGADGLVTMRLFHLSLVYLTVVFAGVAAGAFIR